MLTEDDVTIDRIHPTAGAGSTKAFVSVKIGPVILKGFRVVAAKDPETGDEYHFVGNPSHQNKDGKYYDDVFIEDEEFAKGLKRKVMKAWYETQKSQGKGNN